jgi:hypothetical protein
MKKTVKSLTIKDLLNKVINFNLYSIKSILFRCRYYLLYFLLGVVITYILFLGVITINDYYNKIVFEKKRSNALVEAKLRYKYDKQCRLQTKEYADKEKLTLNDLEYHIYYLECYGLLEDRPLSQNEIKVLKSHWGDDYSRANTIRFGYFFKWKRTNVEPSYCELEYNFFQCK